MTHTASNRRFYGSLASAILLTLVFTAPSRGVQLNEIRLDQPLGPDPDEYFELVGSPGASLTGMTYLVVGGNSSTDGLITMALDLSGFAIPADGYFLAAKSSFGSFGSAFDGILPDLSMPSSTPSFANQKNVTHLLVSGFTGTVNQDLDLDTNGGLDDGILDVRPWSSIVDAVSIVHNVAFAAGSSVDAYYAGALGFTDVGPNNGIAPYHVYRSGNEGGIWTIGADNPLSIGAVDTAGMANPGSSLGPALDFNDDTIVNTLDVDLLVGHIVAVGQGNSQNLNYDLNDDNLVTRADLNAWLVQAGALNLGGVTNGNPYLAADLNLDGSVNDSDFAGWNGHKFTNSAKWSWGDFNADGVSDVFDFNLWNSLKGESSVLSTSAVPEPSSLALIFSVAAAMAFKGRSQSRS